jgi:hypothetical protein
MKAVEEVEKMECESDSLNKEVGSSIHSCCHCLIGVSDNLLTLRLKAEVEGYLRAMKILSTTSFAREINPGSHVVHLLHANDLSLMLIDEIRQN